MKNKFYSAESILLRTPIGYSAIINNKWLIVLLMVVFSAGCKKVIEETGLVGICPIVVSTSPANNATGVGINTTIAATFNEAMEPSSINNATFTLKQGTIPVPGVVTYSGLTAIFSPASNLALNTVYTATVTTGAKDPAGNALVNDYVWSFTTGSSSDIIPPTVISTDPVNGAVNVVINKKITATFSEGMNPLTINSATFVVKQGTTVIAGTVTYSGTTAVFSPTGNLAVAALYTATITTGAQDLSGNAMLADYVWSFTTGATSDIIAPTILSTDPLNEATGVALNKTVTATFSEAMNPLTINNITFTLKQGTAAVPGTVTYSGTTAAFTPLTNLVANTIYTATVSTGVQDLAGNALASDYVWSFTTLTVVPTDITPPTVISTDPVNAATNVILSKKITATFSEPMNTLTINNTTFLLKQGTTTVLGAVTYSGTTATFSPLTNLLANTVYTATIKTGAQDIAGNRLANDYIWSFTTGQLLMTPNLGTASVLGAMGGSAGITNQGLNTVINNGSISTTGASTLITGLHDGTTGDVYTETPLNVGLVSGRIYTAPPAPGNATSLAIASAALLDATNTYISISPAAQPGGTDPGAGELGGLTLPPGVYKAASGTFGITNGNLTLDAMGDPNAVWVFQTAAGLTVGIAGPAGARSIIMINGALPKNVYWYVGSAATINGAGGGIMVGTIIASAGVTFSTAGNTVQTVLNGRALSLNASVTLVNTTINVP
jgi:Ice-binding-like/Bacterial Ig-like domain